MNDLSHLDDDGNVHMVDVGDKAVTSRTATARAVVELRSETVAALFGGDLPKGDALATVRIAAIQGVKRTSDLIPLCHPLPVDGIDVAVEETDEGAEIIVTVRVAARTGVEMEAMTGASVGALTLYDMVKGVDRGARITQIELVTKAGGRSGDWRRV